jgi:uncharacterized OB-fold protein
MTDEPVGTYPPLPEPSDLTRFFWEGVNDHKLLILRCNRCGFYMHLPREVCRSCLSTDLSPAQVSGRAVLDTWTFPNQPFDAFYQARMPYVLAVVELEEQEHLKLLTNIIDCPEDELRIGLPVTVVFEEVAPGVTLPLFAPTDEVAR